MVFEREKKEKNLYDRKTRFRKVLQSLAYRGSADKIVPTSRVVNFAPLQHVLSSSIQPLIFIAVATVGELLRVVIEQEDAPESSRTNCDSADKGLYLDPGDVPCLIVRTYNASGRLPDQTDSDHGKAQATAILGFRCKWRDAVRCTVLDIYINAIVHQRGSDRDS